MRSGTALAATLCGAAMLAACKPGGDAGIGRDCGALVDAAQRAQGCDPSLVDLVAELRAAPDEAQCRSAARTMLTSPTGDPPALRSVHAEDPPPTAEPLSETELEALRTLALPATVVFVPDVPPGPTAVRTRASVGGIELVADQSGRLASTIEPGAHPVALHHSGTTTTYCVELRACETLSVKAHGSKLAHHPDVRPGSCKQ